MRLISRSTLLIVLSALPPLISFGAASDDRSAFTKAIATSRIYGFMEILRNSGLPEEGVNGADVTLIIPIDTAFYTLTPERYTALLAPANKELAARYIRAHVVSGRLTIAQLATGGHKTLGGVEIKIAPGAKTEAAKVNGSRVVLADQAGSKGMFHLIDGFVFQP
jgi:uncharacterized surface protein with fasciclin (FAS1) repeats